VSRGQITCLMVRRTGCYRMFEAYRLGSRHTRNVPHATSCVKVTCSVLHVPIQVCMYAYRVHTHICFVNFMVYSYYTNRNTKQNRVITHVETSRLHKQTYWQYCTSGMFLVLQIYVIQHTPVLVLI
jgi:hypothetical protein